MEKRGKGMGQGRVMGKLQERPGTPDHRPQPSSSQRRETKKPGYPLEERPSLSPGISRVLLMAQQGLEAKEQACPLERSTWALPGDRHVPTCSWPIRPHPRGVSNHQVLLVASCVTNGPAGDQKVPRVS